MYDVVYDELLGTESEAGTGSSTVEASLKGPTGSEASLREPTGI